MPGKKTSTKSNATRKNLTPKDQNKNGTKKVTRTSTGMVAKTPPGSTRGRQMGKFRFS